MRLMRLLGALSAAALAIALPNAAVAQDKVLNVGVATFPDSLQTGPNFYSSLSLTTQTNDPLIKRNNAGDIVPGLAERWEQLDDDTWRFHLRQGVKFHDGVAFTAEDVKFTIERVLDPQTVYGFAVRIAKVTSVDIIDDHTVDLNTDGPYPTLPIGLSEIVMEPKHVYDAGGAQAMIAHPVGTGPFVFGKWVPGDYYELTANADYWDGAPKVDRVMIRAIPSAATRVASLMAGETDIIEEVPVDLLSQIEASSAVRVDEVATTVGLVFLWNFAQPPLNNPLVREALDYAVDKEAIVREILMGRGEVLQGQPLTSNTFGFNPDIKARPYDPEKARAMLAEAGVTPGTRVTLITRSGNYLSDVDIANVVAGMLSEVGLNATVEILEGGVFLQRRNEKALGSGAMIGFFSLGDADFATTWYTKGGNWLLWDSPEFEQLYIDARSTVDRETRRSAYMRMMEIIHTDNPALFIAGLPAIYAVSDRINGFGAASDKVLRLDKVELRQ